MFKFIKDIVNAIFGATAKSAPKPFPRTIIEENSSKQTIQRFIIRVPQNFEDDNLTPPNTPENLTESVHVAEMNISEDMEIQPEIGGGVSDEETSMQETQKDPSQQNETTFAEEPSSETFIRKYNRKNYSPKTDAKTVQIANDYLKEDAVNYSSVHNRLN